jgi:lipopolysaccharide/colanic/teichoic acid biosynthesis glycosyltransferase
MITEMLEQPTVLPDGSSASMPLWNVPPLPLGYRIAKRALDIMVSGLLLVVLSPILLFAAIAIRLSSKGPVLFRQQRVGTGGRIFTMYKFRSMYDRVADGMHKAAYAHFLAGKGGNGKVTLDVLERTGQAIVPEPEDDLTPTPHRNWVRRQLHRLRPFLHAEDPRITPIGALLRITSVDELPQLINVLKGDMSLVGPRPPISYEVRMYRQRHLIRLAVQPGVTGIWQVYGRNKVPFDRMVDMDYEYIRTRTFWLDIKLILRTVPAVLFSRSGK